jgi:hypothetical protein
MRENRLSMFIEHSRVAVRTPDSGHGLIDAAVTVSGPWPPYAFASGELT